MIELDIKYRNKKLWDEQMFRSAQFCAGALTMVASDVITRVQIMGISADGRPFTPYKARPAKRLVAPKEVKEFLSKVPGWEWVDEVYHSDMGTKAAGTKRIKGRMIDTRREWVKGGHLRAKNASGTKDIRLPDFWQGLYWVPTHMPQPTGWIKESKRTGAKAYESRGHYLRARGLTTMKNFTETGGMWDSIRVVMVTPSHGRLYFSGRSLDRGGRNTPNRLKARQAALHEHKDILAVSDSELKKANDYLEKYLDGFVFGDIVQAQKKLVRAQLEAKLARSAKKLISVMGASVAAGWASQGALSATSGLKKQPSFTVER